MFTLKIMKIHNYRYILPIKAIFLSAIPFFIFSLILVNLFDSLSLSTCNFVPRPRLLTIWSIFLWPFYEGSMAFLFNQNLYTKSILFSSSYLSTFLFKKTISFPYFNNSFSAILCDFIVSAIAGFFLFLNENFNTETIIATKYGFFPNLTDSFHKILFTSFFWSSLSVSSAVVLFFIFYRSLQLILYLCFNIIIIGSFFFLYMLSRVIINYNFTVLLLNVTEKKRKKEFEEKKSVKKLKFELDNNLNFSSEILVNNECSKEEIIENRVRLQSNLDLDDYIYILIFELRNLVILIQKMKKNEKDYLESVFVKSEQFLKKKNTVPISLSSNRSKKITLTQSSYSESFFAFVKKYIYCLKLRNSFYLSLSYLNVNVEKILHIQSNNTNCSITTFIDTFENIFYELQNIEIIYKLKFGSIECMKILHVLRKTSKSSI